MRILKLLGAATLLALPTAAAAKDARCLLVVNGTVHIDGPCKFQPPLDIETSERVWRTTNSGDKVLVPRVYTQTTMEGAGIISGYFGSDYALHAHDNLGTLRRQKTDRACWANDFAKLCAW